MATSHSCILFQQSSPEGYLTPEAKKLVKTNATGCHYYEKERNGLQNFIAMHKSRGQNGVTLQVHFSREMFWMA